VLQAHFFDCVKTTACQLHCSDTFTETQLLATSVTPATNTKYWDNHSPTETVRITIDGFSLVAYVFGDEARDTVLCVNGGPGAACDYIRDSHSFLVDHGFRVIAYDQIGTGNSDRASGRTDLWTIERYAYELECVRKAFSLDQFHLLGHSWGGWLAIEYLAMYSPDLSSLVLESTCADIPHFRHELSRLRSALGPEAVAMMLAHEAAGSIDHPEYQAAITILNYRHMCRLKNLPDPVKRTFATYNPEPYRAIQGHNEFVFTGNMSDWSRLHSLSQISAPTLITVGLHDEIPPNCALEMRRRIPNAQIVVFNSSSHQPFFEEPMLFQNTLANFLGKHRRLH
jgi:proline iminopeptidase